jgi:hypothetical protein
MTQNERRKLRLALDAMMDEDTADTCQDLMVLLQKNLPPDVFEQAVGMLEHILHTTGDTDPDGPAAMAQDRRPGRPLGRPLYASDTAALRRRVAEAAGNRAADFIKPNFRSLTRQA